MFWTLGGVIGATFLAQLFVVPEIREFRISSNLFILKPIYLISIISNCAIIHFVEKKFNLSVNKSNHCVLSGNERKSQSLSSLHMLKLPGIIVLVLHCFAYKFVGSSRTIGISSYLYSTVSTYILFTASTYIIYKE